MIRLIESDPWFLATALPHQLACLGKKDLERLTEFVGAGPARGLAATLRAILWYHGGGGPHGKALGRAPRLRRALAFLEEVPETRRDQE